MRVAGILSALVLGTVLSSSATITTTTALMSSLNPSTYGQTVTFTAVVSSASGAPPDGEIVTFEQGTNSLGTGALSGGTATFTISTLKTGSADSVKAVYPGDSNLAKSTSNTVGQVVSKATTGNTLASSQNPSNLGQSVTFTATVAPEFSGTPAGSVTFYKGSNKLGSASLYGGVASYSNTKLPAGTDSITAVYSGNTSFTGSSSAPLSQVVASGTYIDSTLTWDGITRYYEVFVPAALPVNPPMLVMLHGTRYTLTFDPQAVISLDWGYAALASQYGFILVQPASTYDPPTTQWNWNAYFMDVAFPPPAPGTCTEPPATGCPDDIGFLGSLITTLKSQYNVNPNQVYVVGFSSGAQMALSLIHI